MYGIGADTLTYKCKIDSSLLTDPSKMSAALAGKDDLWNVTILSVDDELYEELCRRADAPSGSNLILNTFRRNDRGTMKSFVPFRSEPASLTLSDTEGVLSELPIGGMLYEENLSENGFREPLSDSIRIVVPNARVRYFDWFCDTEDETGYSDYAKKVMNDYYPILTEDSYVEQGYTVRISRADTMAQALNLAIVLAEYVMYGFVILLIVIGFTGVISTISTNTRIRSREFAVLKSIGMTDGALRKMVYSESVVCLVKAIVPGVFFGLLIPFVINLVLRQTMPSRFHFPLFSLIAGVVLVSAVVLLITRVEISKLKSKSIIQEIRMDVM